jgi:hypothetical protein
MGRSWQFFLTIAIVVGVMGYLYYSSDFYAERSAAGPTAETQAPAKPGESAETAAPPEGGTIPLKE